jgi:phosphate starvation-inducible protein PhoH
MKDIQSELSRLKEIIDNAKNNMATLSGRKMELLKQLKKDFKVSSVEEGKKEIQKLDKQLNEVNQAIEKEYQKLKEEYDW